MAPAFEGKEQTDCENFTHILVGVVMFPIDLALIAVIIHLGKQGGHEIYGRHGEGFYLKVNTKDRDRSALLMTPSNH